ncbi:AAA family ATPase [Streptomyces sp. NPDC046197]|uniref:helix-turn-helix transcriptional regulator n=1 Tax=Streptomyces sp. NPDC046197 TaxID=3154337 RepID=UPI0033C29EF2
MYSNAGTQGRSGGRLVGRDAEIEQLTALVTSALAGRSGAVVVRGEAGIGKSALLATVATVPGVVPLSVSCVEGEAELAFAALSGLLRPITHLISRLPAPQARALAVSLALAEPTPGEGAPSGIAIGMGTLGLLAEAAPVVVLVDDVQWMDEASATTLSFALRRLLAEGVAVVMGARSGVPCPVDLGGHPVVDLAGLADEPARELACRVRGTPVEESELERLMYHTGGNPLALIELSSSGIPVGGVGAAEPPLPPPRALITVYRRRLAPLPSATRSALLVCATSYTADAAEIEAALGQGSLNDLEPAEDADLVQLARGQVAFTHPLIRSAVYYEASPAQRRNAHALLARSLTDQGAVSADQRAWHLSAAALGADEEAASALARAGDRARMRGALGAARSAYLRAGELTHDAELRARRTVAAATSAHLAGSPETALTLLAQALEWTSDTQLTADIQHVRNQIQLTRIAPRQVFAQLTEAAATARDTAPATAANLLATAAAVGAIGGLVPQARTAADDGHALALATDGADTMATAVQRIHTLLLVDEIGTATALLDDCLEHLLTADPLVQGVELFGFGSMDLMWLDRHTCARRLLEHGLHRLRGAQASERLPTLISVLAELELRHGRWNAAYAAAAECVSLATELNQPLLVGYAASTLAQIEAAQGHRERCEQYATQALNLLEPAGSDLVTPYALLALAQLELALGEDARAADRLTSLHKRVSALGVRNPAVFPYAADRVEACLRINRPDRARAALADLAGSVTDAAPATVRASLARCQAMLAKDEDQAEEYFAIALDLHALCPDRYNTARTLLALGRRRRRARRRALAREQLEAALLLFRQLGATPWLHRTETELRAVGGRRTDNTKEHVELTAHELQVARLVAQGTTNQETADALCLSVKTIEYHLGNIYAKLGIRSRVELTRCFIDAEP